jgi:hypothetical protein
MSINPYIAWASESIETTLQIPTGQGPPVERQEKTTDDALLYGLTVGWHWRFLGVTTKYYYQDVLDADDAYHTFRLRGNLYLSKRFGITARFEYMEHASSEDISFLIGPAFVF